MSLLIIDLNITLCDCDDVGKVNACHISFPNDINAAELVPNLEVADFLELDESHAMQRCHIWSNLVACLGCLGQLVGFWHDLGGFCFLFDLIFLRGLGLRLFVVDCDGVVLWTKDLDEDLGIIGDLCLFEGLARVESAVFV